MRQILKSLILSIVTIVMLIIFFIPYGQIPSLEKYFDPNIGFCNVAFHDDFSRNLEISFPCLKNKVTVIFDKRGIPHIFAENELEVYGVALTGAPFIIIGFNRLVTWGMTNGGRDVNNFYRVSRIQHYKNIFPTD